MESPDVVTISRRTAEIALRAVKYLEPADRSWAYMPDEVNARRAYAELVVARNEIVAALAAPDAA